MRIRVHADGHNIRLWLPTGMLKSRLAYSIIKRSVNDKVEKSRAKKSLGDSTSDINSASADIVAHNDGKESNTTDNFPITYKQFVTLYRALNKFIKTNGHFNLVEVDSHDGERVVIRI